MIRRTRTPIARKPLPDTPELPAEIEAALRVFSHAQGGTRCLPGQVEAEAFALKHLRSAIAKHLLTKEEARVICDDYEYLYTGDRDALYLSAREKLKQIAGSSRGEK